jgi:hypothetical protein
LSVRLELGKLPDMAGVRAALSVLTENLDSPEADSFVVSVGRVCGGRISGVHLGDSLEVRSFTLEPFELDDAEIGRTRALEFVADLRALMMER